MSFLKKLGDAANKAKDMANEQIQASKKDCAACGEKIGFLTVYREVDGGGRVCDKCLGALGLTMQQYTDNAVAEDFKSISADDIKQALDGDTDKQAHILNLQSVKNVTEKEAAKATAQAERAAERAQVQAQKNTCVTCKGKIGFTTMYCELITDERVCDKCLDKMGLSMKQYTDTAFIESFMVMDLEDIQLALDGDADKLEYILGLSSEMNAAEERAEKEAKLADLQAKADARDAEIEKMKQDAKNEMEEGLVYNFNGGAGDILLVYEDRIVIRRVGLGNALIMGLKGDKTIFFSDITSIQHKAAGTGFTAGYIQFSLPGGKEPQGGVWQAVHDENTITFKENTKEVGEMVKYLQDRLREVKSPKPQVATVVNQVSAADELLKFKGLLDAGVLTQEEFDKKKAELLNM